jgi:hypothetical protein
MRLNIKEIRKLNPEFTVHVYDDEMCREFIVNNFSQDTVDAFDSLIPWAYKADLWRYCVIYINGGIYIDIKFQCINGFRFIALTEQEHLVIDLPLSWHGFDLGVFNGFIAMMPKNQFMLNCINQFVINVKTNFYGTSTLEPTGPILLGKEYLKLYTLEDISKLTSCLYVKKNILMINFNNILILENYPEYRDEQKQYSSLKHHSELYNSKNIYKPITIHNPKTIPAFFINLEKDKPRLKHIQELLSKIWKPEDIYRIEGVVSHIGRDGCRRAHILANETAISMGFEYYVIFEDDVKPLVEIDKIMDYITDSIKENPDLVLFEQREHLEKHIKLARDNNNPKMYRIFANGNNLGCYLCKKSFGLKLIDCWKKTPDMHCDHSCQKLWPANNVYFHRPQLFHQMEGESNQTDVGYRLENKPFDWNLYEKKH